MLRMSPMPRVEYGLRLVLSLSVDVHESRVEENRDRSMDLLGEHKCEVIKPSRLNQKPGVYSALIATKKGSFVDQDSPVDYVFGEFRLPSSHQVLYGDGQLIPITTKLYQLLLFLVSRAGVVCNKDEIIAAVWPGQVVTDAALARQMTRLRQLLNDATREIPYIETHRGIGYRFCVPVRRCMSAKTPLPGPVWRRPSALRVPVGLVLLMVLLLWMVYSNDGAQTPDSGQASLPDQPVSVAILPRSPNADWLEIAAVGYMAELLGQLNYISAINPDPHWFDYETPEKVAIELTTLRNIQYAIQLSVRAEEAGYTAEATLRNRDGVVGSQSVAADTLPAAFRQLHEWVRQQVAAQHRRPPRQETATSGSSDPAALDSYLLAIQALQGEGDLEHAARALEAALARDPGFLLARVRLARVLLQSGQQESGMAMAESLLGLQSLSKQPAMAAELWFDLAMAHFRARNLEEAKAAFEQSARFLNEQDNPFLKMTGLRALELVKVAEGDLEGAVALGLQRLETALQRLPLPKYLGEAHLDIANWLHQLNRFAQSRQHIDAARLLFEQVQDINGLMKSFAMLSRHFYLVNDMDAGVNLTYLVDPWLDRKTLVHDEAEFLVNAGAILNLRGHFDKSAAYAARLRALAVSSGNVLYRIFGEYVMLHQQYVRQDFAGTLSYSTVLANDALAVEPNYAMAAAATVAILASARVEDPADTRERIAALEDRFGDSIEIYATFLERARGHLALREGNIEGGLRLLHSVRDQHLALHQRHVATYVGYEILQALADHPELPYRDLLDTLDAEGGYSYLLYKLKAHFLAREGEFLAAHLVMEENRLRANQLWRPEDQAALEQYQKLAERSPAQALNEAAR